MPTASNDNQSRLPTDGSRLRQIGFLPLLAIFYGYTAGGPFGFENIYRDAGPGMALVFLTFVPFFWSIPISFAAAELNSILQQPDSDKRAFGQSLDRGQLFRRQWFFVA